MKPSVKDDGREQVNKKYILAEDKDARIHPVGDEQDHATSDQPHDERGGGLIHEAVPFEQVAEHNAAAEERDEDVDGDDGVRVRHREGQPGVPERERPQIHPHGAGRRRRRGGGGSWRSPAPSGLRTTARDFRTLDGS